LSRTIHRGDGGCLGTGLTRVAFVDVVLPVQLEDCLQAIAQIFTALDAKGTGGTNKTGIGTSGGVVKSIDGFIDLTEERDVRSIFLVMIFPSPPKRKNWLSIVTLIINHTLYN
jgi:hypothetical protein